MNTPYKHREILGQNTFVYDLGDLYCVWQNATDDTLLTEITLDFFVREKTLYAPGGGELLRARLFARYACRNSRPRRLRAARGLRGGHLRPGGGDDPARRLRGAPQGIRNGKELSDMGKLIRAIAGDGSLVCTAVDSTDIAAEAERVHRTSATVTAALGRLMTAASIMGSQLKNEEDSVTVRLAGGGPAGSLIAVSDARGNPRGYVANPVVEIPLNRYGKLDVAGAVGKNGTLTVPMTWACPSRRSARCRSSRGRLPRT